MSNIKLCPKGSCHIGTLRCEPDIDAAVANTHWCKPDENAPLYSSLTWAILIYVAFL